MLELKASALDSWEVQAGGSLKARAGGTNDHYLEGQEDLVSRLATLIIHIEPYLSHVLTYLLSPPGPPSNGMSCKPLCYSAILN